MYYIDLLIYASLLLIAAWIGYGFVDGIRRNSGRELASWALLSGAAAALGLFLVLVWSKLAAV